MKMLLLLLLHLLLIQKKDKIQNGIFFSKPSGHHSSIFDLAIFDQIARMEERSREPSKMVKLLFKVFTSRINISPPPEGPELEEWNKRINLDIEHLKAEKNKKNLKKILERNNLECEEIDTPLLVKQVFAVDNIEKIVGWAVSHCLMNIQNLTFKNDKLVLPLNSIEYGINTLKLIQEPDIKSKSIKDDLELENEFERRLLAEVIPPNEINIKFEDIGALDEVKQTLTELVMLPLQRPELFSRGSLTKPCKGILLFGPPGTGKTMLAKAVATQSGANFLNISMSTIASKWFGEGEKYVKAIFTLASKISPTVVFIDEVDSILGKRDKTGEHEAMRKIKNEFMQYWDGLKTKENERVLVLAATNRPFDLDDAVLRRLSRRILIDLPDTENRVKILKVILAKEELESNFDFEQLAKMTEGFTGSDIKNLCIAAAYQPIREILQKEKEEKKKKR
jgi:SpoVK/Ycf46/Vps4 family AAA+-type ATPase